MKAQIHPCIPRARKDEGNENVRCKKGVVPLRGKPENSIKRGWGYLLCDKPWGALVLQTSRNESLSVRYFLS